MHSEADFEGTHVVLTHQERLQQIWDQLKMPEKQRLDMAIKYSGDLYHDKLENVNLLFIKLI